MNEAWTTNLVWDLNKVVVEIQLVAKLSEIFNKQNKFAAQLQSIHVYRVTPRAIELVRVHIHVYRCQQKFIEDWSVLFRSKFTSTNSMLPPAKLGNPKETDKHGSACIGQHAARSGCIYLEFLTARANVNLCIHTFPKFACTRKEIHIWHAHRWAYVDTRHVFTQSCSDSLCILDLFKGNFYVLNSN